MKDSSILYLMHESATKQPQEILILYPLADSLFLFLMKMPTLLSGISNLHYLWKFQICILVFAILLMFIIHKIILPPCPHEGFVGV